MKQIMSSFTKLLQASVMKHFANPNNENNLSNLYVRQYFDLLHKQNMAYAWDDIDIGHNWSLYYPLNAFVIYTLNMFALDIIRVLVIYDAIQKGSHHNVREVFNSVELPNAYDATISLVKKVFVDEMTKIFVKNYNLERIEAVTKAEQLFDEMDNIIHLRSIFNKSIGKVFLFNRTNNCDFDRSISISYHYPDNPNAAECLFYASNPNVKDLIEIKNVITANTSFNEESPYTMLTFGTDETFKVSVDTGNNVHYTCTDAYYYDIKPVDKIYWFNLVRTIMNPYSSDGKKFIYSKMNSFFSYIHGYKSKLSMFEERLCYHITKQLKEYGCGFIIDAFDLLDRKLIFLVANDKRLVKFATDVVRRMLLNNLEYTRSFENKFASILLYGSILAMNTLILNNRSLTCDQFVDLVMNMHVRVSYQNKKNPEANYEKEVPFHEFFNETVLSIVSLEEVKDLV
ncbi:MAG: hypothetical protein KatS3mg083_285 [Candidatus Dojkabacteria bacterium]|nr:MAG: hypothetical protein KatS3mg083_285 [Candidatus Dojkabacteria bacterium]